MGFNSQNLPKRMAWGLLGKYSEHAAICEFPKIRSPIVEPKQEASCCKDTQKKDPQFLAAAILLSN